MPKLITSPPVENLQFITGPKSGCLTHHYTLHFAKSKEKIKTQNKTHFSLQKVNFESASKVVPNNCNDKFWCTGCPKKSWFQNGTNQSWGISGTFDRNFDAKKSFDRLQIFFIFPTWVKENCKKISDKNTACNMVKIQFEKYEKVEKIQNFEIEIAKQMQLQGTIVIRK